MLLPSLTLDELRRRVREAEASLRVAQQYARDARENPAEAEHASARIQAICREVQELFPGLTEPVVPDPRAQELTAALGAAIHGREADAGDSPHSARVEGDGFDELDDADDAEDDEDDEEDEEETYEDGEEDEDGADDEDGDDGEDGEEEWDIDYAKLAAAIENPELMARFPEPDRATFKNAALYLIEAHERQELFAHVIRALEEVSALAQENVEETRRKLALALTIEAHSAKNKA
jgi:ribonuclease E